MTKNNSEPCNVCGEVECGCADIPPPPPPVGPPNDTASGFEPMRLSDRITSRLQSLFPQFRRSRNK